MKIAKQPACQVGGGRWVQLINPEFNYTIGGSLSTCGPGKNKSTFRGGGVRGGGIKGMAEVRSSWGCGKKEVDSNRETKPAGGGGYPGGLV